MPGYELIGQEERDALNELMNDGGILYPSGFDEIRNNRYRVQEFENRFSEIIGVKFAQSVSSGTAALKTALVAAGIKPGDEVITQDFTFIATVEAIVDIGAIPIIVNIDNTLNMDPKCFESVINEKTKAVIPVHMLGVAARIDEIIDIAHENNLIVIDDNCEALGSDWGNEKLGVQADICCWSFDFGKTITTGEGGMVTTNNEEYYNLANEYQDHGHENNLKLPRGRDTHRISGFNFRLSELNAAFGLAQIEKLDFIVERNRRNYDIMKNELNYSDKINFREIPSLNKPLCDCLIFSLDTKSQAIHFVELMKSNGLGTKIIPDAVEWHFAKYWDHIFSNYGISKEELNIMTEESASILERTVSIPIMVNYSENQAKEIGEKLTKISNKL